MYLKSLELHGFKSFPEKTVIEFDHGSTVIVGPNGSGKSNITDAMRWVLGELSSKNIRGTKMEDVIFVGADGYRQMNFAEVSVTFDDSEKPKKLNSDYDEITVTRRYYRSGDSEYFINRKNVRLRDIYELFMNTGIGRDGYSIIGQGKIAEIISKKSEDRRSIFEETAGISKYRYRKHESERKLQETENNMARVSDILTELEGRVGPLERASKKAHKYIELFEKKKEADISLWLFDMVKSKADIEKLEDDCKISRHELDIAEDTLNQLSGQSDRLFEESQNNKLNQSRLYEEIKTLRENIHLLEKEYQILENNIVHEQSKITGEEAFAQKDQKVIQEEQARIFELRNILKAHSNEELHVTADLNDIIQKGNELEIRFSELKQVINDKFDEIKRLENEKSEIDIRIGIIDNYISSHTERTQSISSEIKGYESELNDKRLQLADVEKIISEYDSNIGNLEEQLRNLDTRVSDKKLDIDQDKRLIDSLNAEKSAIDSRINALSGMLEHFEGYNNSVRFVMNESRDGSLSGIRGPVSYLIKVADEYTVAIETALGSALQGIVVENEQSAKDAIRMLKNANTGRATFYPLTSVKGRIVTSELEQTKLENGFVGIASDLVQYDSIYSGIVSSLLGGIAVFDNIDSATEAAKRSGYRIRVVTLDGQQINIGGSFTGGSVRKDSGIITRKNQIDKLEKESLDLEHKIRYNESGVEQKQIELDSLISDQSNTYEKLHIFEALKKTESSDSDELAARCDVLVSVIDKLRHDMEEMEIKEKNGTASAVQLKDQAELLIKEIEQLASERSILAESSHDIDAEISDNSNRNGELRIRLAEIRKDVENSEKEIQSTENRIAGLEASVKEHLDQAQIIKDSIENARLLIEEKKQDASNYQEELAKKEKEFSDLEQGGIDFEKRLNEINRRSRELSSKKELIFESYTKAENKLQNLRDEIEKTAIRIFDEYELTHASAMEIGYPEVTKETRSVVVQTLNETKNAIRALGSVNVDAIQEYAEVKERYDSVKTQYDDLLASKQELNALISTISSEMETIFRDAFDRINKNFGEVFKELFGGGHAELSLSDPEDVLNCGIEISAAPPGKLIKSLSLLSGGEQAFVAIALMFALIKVNPSPFCIFDEIEAALDEVNVSRVANYVSRFSKDIQIIMITHRRGTMEIADTLYGVTMPRHGVSKVFTLDVASVSKQKFAEENLRG